VRNRIISITVGVLVLGVLLMKAITLPPDLRTARLVEIPEGATAVEIARRLEEKRVVKKANWFLYLTNRYGLQGKLQAGIYEFSGRTPLKKVISMIVKGEVVLIRITVPEGYTVKEIAGLLENKKLVDSREFIQYARDNKKLEGMLFPDTYFFPHNVSTEAIAGTMFRRFMNVFGEIYGKEITDSNFKKAREIVTIASIVEKEAMYSNEREIIAGIIYKRLKKDMPIQSCSTVIYALGMPKSRLSGKDLNIKSPYNTYVHRGLPPGPICNPGFSSLKAAVNPKKTDYLYFVSMGDGRNYFSKTYQEHLAASKRFLSSGTASETSSVRQNSE